MKQFKGTPGAWRVSEKHGEYIDIRHNNDEPGAISLNLAKVVARQSWVKEAEANAKLIAAAPELLDALQKALPHVRNQATVDTAAFYMLEKMHGAIAKALGE